MTYTVKAPVIQVQDGRGAYHHVYEGAPLPSGVSGRDIERLVEEGFICEAEPSSDLQKAPAKSANRDAWVTYAVAQGMAEAEAKKASKGDLVKAFTEPREPTQPPSPADPDDDPADDPDRLTS